MQVLVFVIGLIGLITVVIGGAIWTIIVMAPTCVLIGLVVFLVVRVDRKRAAERDDLERDASRQRLLNEREYAAWHASVEDARRQDDKRRRLLRRLEGNRDPPIG